MMKSSFKSLALAGAMAAVIGVGAAHADKMKPGEGKSVQPVESPSLEEKFQHQILYRALEDLGYEVEEPLEVEFQTLHLALGAGDADFTAAHWNALHNAFYEEAGGADAMTKLSNYIEGALQGYLVDKASYDAGVTNLEDLKDPEVAERFDSDGDGKADLAGCVPGWGCERVIEHQLTEYGLRDTVNHNQGAYNAIIADAIAREQNGNSILYYTWTPYWVSGVLVPGENVEWLEVPYTSLPDGNDGDTAFKGKNLGFQVENIRILGNNNFLADNPAAKTLFEAAAIDINDVSAQNNKMRDGEDSLDDIARHVDEWIEAHRDSYDAWLKAAREAVAG